MLVNVCGCGSSGSTLLSQILNQHSQIYSGDELGFFSKNVFYENYTLVKRWKWLISRYGISSRPYFDDMSVFRNLDFYRGLNHQFVWRAVSECDSIYELAKLLEKNVLAIEKKQVWAEKTPENIYCIRHFVEAFPDAKVLHIVRDPRDTICSLVARGHTLTSAAETWLCSVAMIQPFVPLERVHEIRYEDLVMDARLELEKICRFIGVPYEDQMLVPSGNIRQRGRRHRSAWRSLPTEPISVASVGRYKEEDYNFSDIYSMKLTPALASREGISEYYLVDLMDQYGYQREWTDKTWYYSKPKQKWRQRLPPVSRRRILEAIIRPRKRISKVEF